ncbi:MAG TPA: V-type ATPase subunit [Gemmatimonadaceae bacterium]|nr:V-type ATPase subunit [Gemmatimonadaceae bacterium]
MLVRSFDDVIARVRGLSSRLLGRPELERLALSRDTDALVDGFKGTSYDSIAALTTREPIPLEREARRVAGGRLGIISAWCADRDEVLVPLFEDEDRRNLRALTRAVLAQTPPEQRTAGLLPTPGLPAPALEEIAHLTRLRDVAALLTSWGNPYGRAISVEALRPHPDLFLLQLAIDRTFAARALDAATRFGEPILSYVRLLIDAENGTSVMALASGAIEHDHEVLFIPGGSLIAFEDYRDLSTMKPHDARARLSRIVAGTQLAPIASAAAGTNPDNAVLTAHLRELHRTSRLNPLSLTVLLEYILRLRAETHDVARVIWGIAMQMPRRRIINSFVTP